MLGAYGHLVRGVRDLSAAFIAKLRRVRRVHGHNPAAILRHIVSDPLDERTTVPPAMLHRVSDPAQIFHGHDRVTLRVGQGGYLLRRENRQLALLPGRRLAVKLRLIQRRHPGLPIME